MQEIIEQIHAADGQFEIAVTGGGASAVSQLLGVAGASRSILNAVVPYSENALKSYLGTIPDSACSAKTARLLANRAFHNARQLSATKVMGIGATAALQTNRDRRGEDRIFVAIQNREYTRVYQLSLNKAEDRTTQEQRCAKFIIQIIATNLGVNVSDTPPPVNQQVALPNWQALICGETDKSSTTQFKAIFPGAFNPPHQGHLVMRKIAEKHLGTPVAFEISAFNVDKPPLDYIDFHERETHLDDAPLVFTHAAKFIEKAGLFPGATFVVGIDTLVRIDDAKYYGDSEVEKAAAISAFASRHHQFLVFGRVHNGNFQSLDQVMLSPELRALCISVPESEFRLDISSSEIRSGQ